MNSDLITWKAQVEINKEIDAWTEKHTLGEIDQEGMKFGYAGAGCKNLQGNRQRSPFPGQGLRGRNQGTPLRENACSGLPSQLSLHPGQESNRLNKPMGWDEMRRYCGNTVACTNLTWSN